jgi:hypothetical protein
MPLIGNQLISGGGSGGGGAGTGDIDSVTAGAGLTGGGTSGAVTLDVGAGTGITVNADDVAVDTTVIAVVARQIISGGGLTGGGTLAADRTLAVGAGTGITVNADDVAVDQTFAPTWTGTHTWSTSDNGTTTVTRSRVSQHRNNAAGTPAAGYGVGQTSSLDSSARTLRTASQIDTVWSVATDAAETAQFQFTAITAGTMPSTAAVTIDGVACTKGLITDAATNTSTPMLTLDHRSTGTSAASYGTGILLRGQDASNSAGGDDLAQIDALLTTATSGSEATSISFKTRAAGAAVAESMKILGGAAGQLTVLGAATISGGTTLLLQSSSGLAKLKSGSTAGTCAITPGATDTYNARGITTSGTTITNEFTGIAHTGQATTVESPEFKITMPTKTWAAGTIASQAFLKVTAPTIAFASASTATICTTAEFAAPVAGTNATITDGYSSVFKSKIRVESAVALGGGAAPTVGTIGGSGPATAAQNEWIAIDTQNGRRFVPAWA